MEDGTTLLFGLDGFRVVSVTRSPIGVRQVLIKGASQEQACPNCGVFSTRVHSRWIQRVKDLPYGAPVEVSWDKRRFGCDEGSCPRRTFTEVSAQLGPRRRLTLRLCHRLEAAVSRGPRSIADVAREYAVSWWSANQALIDRAADVLGPAPAGVRWLGVDETRVRRVRWLLEESGWKRSDPWMTSFVDLDPTRPAGLLGMAPGRSGAAVTGWLDRQSPAFRDGIEVVAIDPSAPFAAAIRRTLPQARLVVITGICIDWPT